MLYFVSLNASCVADKCYYYIYIKKAEKQNITGLKSSEGIQRFGYWNLLFLKQQALISEARHQNTELLPKNTNFIQTAARVSWKRLNGEGGTVAAVSAGTNWGYHSNLGPGRLSAEHHSNQLGLFRTYKHKHTQVNMWNTDSNISTLMDGHT